LVCGAAHDDYDNGHCPNDNREARCNNCRMLVLICNDCRPKWRCHGEDQEGSSEDGRQPIYCNIDRCVHEGAAPESVLIHGKDELEISTPDLEVQGDSICRAYSKLKEVWERFPFDVQNDFSQSAVAMDCGAAPGGWTKFLLEMIPCSRVYAVDPAKLAASLTGEERLRYLPLKIQDALPIIQQELSNVPRLAVSIWVCDMNCRKLSFPIDCLLETRRLGLVGAGTLFVLTLKLVKGHGEATFDMLVQEQVQRLTDGSSDYRFEKVHVLHLFSNRIRERTIMGYCI
jgi:hypothetical protein